MRARTKLHLKILTFLNVASVFDRVIRNSQHDNSVKSSVVVGKATIHRAALKLVKLSYFALYFSARYRPPRPYYAGKAPWEFLPATLKLVLNYNSEDAYITCAKIVCSLSRMYLDLVVGELH